MSNIAISEITTEATSLNSDDLILVSKYNNGTYTSAKMKACNVADKWLKTAGNSDFPVCYKRVNSSGDIEYFYYSKLLNGSASIQQLTVPDFVRKNYYYFSCDFKVENNTYLLSDPKFSWNGVPSNTEDKYFISLVTNVPGYLYLNIHIPNDSNPLS